MRRHVKSGKQERDNHRDKAYGAEDCGHKRRNEVVFAALEILREDKGSGEGDGGTVHQNTHPSFREFCRQNIRLFRRSDFAENRMLARGDKRRDVGGVGNTVNIDFLDAVDDLFRYLFVDDSVEIADGDIRLRAPSRLLQFKFQFGGFQTLSEKDHIRFDVLDKALARSLYRNIGGRFGHGAHGQHFCADDQSRIDSVHEEEAVSVEHLREKFFGLRLFFELGKE